MSEGKGGLTVYITLHFQPDFGYRQVVILLIPLSEFLEIISPQIINGAYTTLLSLNTSFNSSSNICNGDDTFDDPYIIIYIFLAYRVFQPMLCNYF